ncbi:MAG: ABC transporter permease [Bacillaceae bacterium]
MKKVLKNERMLNIMVPLLSAVFGLVVGAIVMIISGYDPIEGYRSLINGMIGTPRAIGETLRAAIPLILTGGSVAFAFRTGLFNIGVEGQLLVGWLAAVLVGIYVDLPMVLHIPLAILVAFLAGALWGFIPGLLKGLYRVNEVIITIMLNYVALYSTAYIIKEFMHAGNEKTEVVKETASLSSDFLSSITGSSRFHWGFLVAIIAMIVMSFILSKTTLGYELKAVGFNQHAAQYAGMNVSRNIILSMSIAGGFAGLAGAVEGLGTYGYMTATSSFSGLGFDGIAVALLGMNNPIGIIVAATLFGGLKSGSAQMSFDANVPAELINIIIACIIFFVACSYLVRFALKRLVKEEN